MQVFYNPAVEARLPDAVSPTEPCAFHRGLPGYRETPLHDLAGTATELGLGALHVKDESSRFGLPAFKILGASWAACCHLAAAPPSLDAPPTLAALAHRAVELGLRRLVTATDGNHGRAVARTAAWLGLDATVLLPRGTAGSRVEAVSDEGAEAIVVDGSYDDAVRMAAAAAGGDALLLQDTGWPGYEEIPERVVQGYATLYHEIDAQLAVRRCHGPDLVMIQVGVGSLATATVRHYRRPAGPCPPRIVGVEPRDADCLRRSLQRGEPVVVPGPHRSILAGLNAGEVSAPGWPWLRRGLDACVAVDDDRAADAVRRLAAVDVVSGESGAAGLAGLLELIDQGGLKRLSLPERPEVLLISTEGVTDPAGYRRIMEKAVC